MNQIAPSSKEFGIVAVVVGGQTKFIATGAAMATEPDPVVYVATDGTIVPVRA